MCAELRISWGNGLSVGARTHVAHGVRHTASVAERGIERMAASLDALGHAPAAGLKERCKTWCALLVCTSRGKWTGARKTDVYGI